MFSRHLLGLVEDAIRGIGGSIGIRLRRAYYRHRLRRCGARLVIESGVEIIGPEYVSLGDDVWLDRGVILIAGQPNADAEIEIKPNPSVSVGYGEITIGNRAHVGIGTIIQGHGGVQISDCFTSSPHVKIYSFSNDHRKCRNGTVRALGGRQNYLLTPVCIKCNVWLGMNVVLIGHTIGADTFVKPGSVVSIDVTANSLVAGGPAKRVGNRFGVSLPVSGNSK